MSFTIKTTTFLLLLLFFTRTNLGQIKSDANEVENLYPLVKKSTKTKVATILKLCSYYVLEDRKEL